MSDNPRGDGQSPENPDPLPPQYPYGPQSPQPPYGPQSPQPPYGPPPQFPYGQSPYGPPPYGPPPYGPPPYGPPGGGGYYGSARSAYAHWGTRLGAYVVDAVIPVVVLGVVANLLVAVAGDTGALISSLLYFGLLGFEIWNLFLLQGRTGQTIGKGLFGIMLIDERTGRPPGGGMTFVRSLAKTIDTLICYVGWLFPLWDAKRQTVSDKIMHTVVVPGGDPAKKKF